MRVRNDQTGMYMHVIHWTPKIVTSYKFFNFVSEPWAKSNIIFMYKYTHTHTHTRLIASTTTNLQRP